MKILLPLSEERLITHRLPWTSSHGLRFPFIPLTLILGWAPPTCKWGPHPGNCPTQSRQTQLLVVKHGTQKVSARSPISSVLYTDLASYAIHGLDRLVKTKCSLPGRLLKAKLKIWGTCKSKLSALVFNRIHVIFECVPNCHNVKRYDSFSMN